ncbi:hypothetical protein [Methylobacter sp.]|uniref:hypothetical protein n=1 Tax=Methylobacter sp. TaxID=2051955 RepID=UPI0025F52815|nr:hypothetical protein [Methylobacter sp.]
MFALTGNPDDWNKIAQGDTLSIPDVRNAIRQGNRIKVINLTKNETYGPNTRRRNTRWKRCWRVA